MGETNDETKGDAIPDEAVRALTALIAVLSRVDRLRLRAAARDVHDFPRALEYCRALPLVGSRVALLRDYIQRPRRSETRA